MHTLLLLFSFTLVYAALKRVYFRIEQSPTWFHRSGLVCYLLGSACLFLLAVTFDFWLMYATGCMAFQSLNWDTLSSLGLGAILWLCLGISIVRSLWSQWRLQKVLSLVSECPEHPARAMVTALSDKLGVVAPDLRVYHSSQPYAATLFSRRPVILLSTWMLQSLDEEQLEAVLAHELAHIRRRDNLMVGVLGILKNVLFFLPTIQLAWDNFLSDLETAADDLTVMVTGNPEALASAIVEVHREHPQTRFAYGISYFTPDYAQIEKRVTRLLDQNAHRQALNANADFSSWRFGKDIVLSAVILVLSLSAILFLPYCHWVAHHANAMHIM